MQSYTIRRVPWTCEWGRFGVTIEELAAGQSRIDDVFWACHHSSRESGVRLMKQGECERCPFWMEAARLRVSS